MQGGTPVEISQLSPVVITINACGHALIVMLLRSHFYSQCLVARTPLPRVFHADI